MCIVHIWNDFPIVVTVTVTTIESLHLPYHRDIMSEQHAHVVYTKLLLARGHGYPLWIPEPDYTLPPEYIDKGISVGDVVMIRDDGGFDFLFNIFLEADHPVNRDRVPPRFEPLRVSDVNPTRTIYLQHGRRSSVTSSLVTTLSIAAGGSATIPFVPNNSSFR